MKRALTGKTHSIDYVDRVSLLEGADVLHHSVHQPLACLSGRPGNMGRDETVVQPQQGTVRRNRLPLGYVYGGPGDLTIQQRISQSGFVDQGARVRC